MKALKPPTTKVYTDKPELAERFNRVLSDAVAAMDESGLRYAFIGGIASGGMGRPRSTHDIDIFVRPEDALLALRAFEKSGFNTEQTDPSWLYKAFKENILVDVIFKSKGEIYLDHEMWQRTSQVEFHGKQLRMVAPEDLVVIKALAHSELTPGHWHDALALLSHANIDWEYLLKRAKRGPRRILSLMLYAQSNDIWVPKRVVDDLYRAIFSDTQTSQPLPSQQQQQQPISPANHVISGQKPNLTVVPPTPHPHSQKTTEKYAAAVLKEALAKDNRTNELEIQIEQMADRVLLRGDVISTDRRDAVLSIARELFPGLKIENQLRVPDITAPSETEDFR
jgi:predicted nucleotidyltransferase